jgi:carboxylate-amine ligase
MRSSAVLTMGVEEEFLLVDSGTGAVVPRAGEVLAFAAASGMDLQGELTRTQVETATPVCRELGEVHARLARQRRTLAQAANWPFRGGQDTGYASWRIMQWSRWPTAGPPPYLESAQQYQAVVDALVDSGVVLDRAMLYWWVRPSAVQPTLEFRVGDVAATVEEAVLAAALVRGLVATALEDLGRDEPPPAIPGELLRAAQWRAARDGLEGHGIDVLSGRQLPAWELVARLLTYIRPALEVTGDLEEVIRLVVWLRRHGSGASRQRAAYVRRGRLRDVVDLLTRQTVDGADMDPMTSC